MRKELLVIFFTVFVDLLGFGILIPLIPILLADPKSSNYILPASVSVSQGFIMLGFLTAIFPFMQFLAAPVLGQLSDKYGRRRILAISLAGTCLSYVIFALGIIFKNIPLLFFSRAVDGITGGNIAVAQAAIADITLPENRVKNFALLGAAFGFGFVLGPYLGGKLSDPAVLPWFTTSTPFWFAAILSFLNVLSVLFFFPETRKNLARHVKINFNKSIHNIFQAYNYQDLRPIYFTNFLYQGGFTFFTTFVSVYLLNRFAFTPGNIGDYFAYIGIWGIIAQSFLVRWVAKRWPEYKVLRITMIFSGTLILIYISLTHAWQLFFLTPFLSIANSLSFTNMTGLVSKTADNSIQGEVLGINASVQALAQSWPPVLSGFIAASLTPEAPLFVSAVFIILAGFVFLFMYKPVIHVLHQEE